jgi:hypothetical protein
MARPSLPPLLSAGGAEISCAASMVSARLVARTACTEMAPLLTPISAESVPVAAATRWFWGGYLASTDVIAIPSQTPGQAEFDRVARVTVSKAEMERSQKSDRVVQIYPNKLAGEST